MYPLQLVIRILNHMTSPSCPETHSKWSKLIASGAFRNCWREYKYASCLFMCLSVHVSVCLFMCLYVCLFMCLSVCSCVCMSVCSCVCISVCWYVCLFCVSVCSCVCLWVCLSVHMSVCLSVHVSVCLSVHVSVCLSVCMSVCLSVYYLICVLFAVGQLHTSSTWYTDQVNGLERPREKTRWWQVTVQCMWENGSVPSTAVSRYWDGTTH